MRRASSILLLLLAIVGGLLFYVRRSEQSPPVEQAQPRPASPVTATSPSATLPPPRLAVPPKSLDAGREPATAPPDEASLMRQIRALVKSHPEKAELLAREARRRFPNGAEADERDSLLVDALVNQQRIGRARDETYYYFDHYPDGRFADHLSIMTGVRPRPGRKK